METKPKTVRVLEVVIILLLSSVLFVSLFRSGRQADGRYHVVSPTAGILYRVDSVTGGVEQFVWDAYSHQFKLSGRITEIYKTAEEVKK